MDLGGGKAEGSNLILTIKRQEGMIGPAGGDGVKFKTVRIDSEVNTVLTNADPRFTEESAARYLTKAAVVLDGLTNGALEHIGWGAQ